MIAFKRVPLVMSPPLLCNIFLQERRVVRWEMFDCILHVGLVCILASSIWCARFMLLSFLGYSSMFYQTPLAIVQLGHMLYSISYAAVITSKMVCTCIYGCMQAMEDPGGNTRSTSYPPPKVILTIIIRLFKISYFL